MASTRSSIPLALAAVGVLALLPRPALWVGTMFHGPLTFVLAPIQEPVWRLKVWLAGSGRDAAPPTPVVDADAWNEMLRQLNQARQESDDLRTMVRDLSRGVELNPELVVRQIA